MKALSCEPSPVGNLDQPSISSQTGGPTAKAIQNLHPAYFAMVMATGIVAIAAHLTGFLLVAKSLTWLNLAAFLVLSAMTVARTILYPHFFFRDLIDHNRGVGFFTIVAGTGVLGSQLVIILARYTAAMVLWVLAIVLWAGFTYTIFTVCRATIAATSLHSPSLSRIGCMPANCRSRASTATRLPRRAATRGSLRRASA